jgi:rhomboid protease GluP
MIEPQSQPNLPVNPPEQINPPLPKPTVRLAVKARVPSVTYFFLGSTILVFLLQYLSSAIVNFGVKNNDLILAGQLWRLITPIWLHANLLHVFFNMYALFVIGPSLEQQYGHWRFLALYLLCGFAGNTLSFLFSNYDSLGASTAIFGLIGAQAVFLLQNRRLLGQRANRMLINIGLVIVLNLAISFAPGIDLWGHLGGLIAGLAFAWMAGPVWGASPGLNEIEISDQRPEFRYLQTSLLLFVVIAVIAASKFFIK